MAEWSADDLRILFTRKWAGYRCVHALRQYNAKRRSGAVADMNRLTLHVEMGPRMSCCIFRIFVLWVCLFAGMVTTERTCSTDFDDVASSALLAPIVVEGRARRVVHGRPTRRNHTDNGVEQPSPAVSVVFDRLRLFKGRLTESDGEVRSIEVGYFRDAADREACVAPLPRLHRSYVLFVRKNDTGRSGESDGVPSDVDIVENDGMRQRSRGYRLSAFPVRKSRRNIATVVSYTNCSICGMLY